MTLRATAILALLALASLAPANLSAAKQRPLFKLPGPKPDEVIRRFNADTTESKLIVLLSPT